MGHASKLLVMLVASACEGSIEVELEAIEIESFTQLTFVLRTVAEHGAALWREPQSDQHFALDSVPLLWMRAFADGSVDVDGYLLQHPSPRGPQALHPVFDGLAPVHLQEVSAALLGGRPYNLAISLSGAETFVFAWMEQLEDSLDPRTPGFSAFLVHESFHRYQLYEGGWTMYASFVQAPERYPIVGSNIALALLEGEVLAAGLRAASLADLEQALRQFVAVRRARRALPDVVVDGINFVEQSDHALELYEGSARHVEQRFLELTNMTSAEESVNGLLAELDAPLLESDVSMTAAQVRMYFSRSRHYQTGDALGRLLDRLHRDWRSPAANGKAPFHVLEARYSYLSNDALAGLLEEAKVAHDFNGIIAARTTWYLSRPEGADVPRGASTKQPSPHTSCALRAP